MRVAIVLMHPAPYREPVIARLKEKAGHGISVFSLFAEDFGHAGNRLGDESRPIIKSTTLYPRGFAALKACIKLCARFARSRKFDFVVWPAYAPWWLTVPVVLRSILRQKGAVALDTVRESGGWFQRKIKGYIFRRAKFLWVPGDASRKYVMEHYGIDASRIVEGLYLPDFRVAGINAEKHEKPTYLMVANRTASRMMDVVADGFRKFLKGGGNGRLILCGKGTGELSGDGVEILEGGEWNNLASLYKKADVYVHNGSEQFSTATLMGAMAGLPLLVGSEVGVCADLFAGDGECPPGVLVDDWRSVDAWANAFARMSDGRENWTDMGAVARRQASKFSVEEVAMEVSKRIQ